MPRSTKRSRAASHAAASHPPIPISRRYAGSGTRARRAPISGPRATAHGFARRPPGERERRALTISPRQFRKCRENPRPGADALVVALEVVFLVRRMDVVVVEPEADQERVEPKRLPEIGDDRDRRARADQKRLLAPFLRQRLLGGGERFHVPVERDRGRGGMVAELGLAVFRNPRAHVIAEGL